MTNHLFVEASILAVQEWFFSRLLSRLANESDGHMDDIHRQRDALSADLVSLASHRDGGVAFAPGAFSVSGSSPGTFAHEIGHNFGLQHERSQWESEFSTTYPRHFQHGYVTLTESSRRCMWTIMAYGSLCERLRRYISYDLPLFSSPALSSPVDGTPLGVSRFSNQRGAAGPADAVLHLNRAREAIADFKPSRSAN